MTHSSAEDAALNLSPRAKLEILGAILLAMFLFALDQTVVGVALPKIITDLGGNELYTWAVTIYLLTSTISGPIYGKLSDLYGRRPIVIFAVSLFLIASALCGLAQEMWQFILFRGLQGLGGGAIFPVALAVIADLYTPAERGKYLGLFGAVFGMSSLIGPGLGGLLTDTVGWNWIFFINIPIGLVALFILWRLLPAIKRPEAGRDIDYLGAAVFAGAIAAFLIGLTNKQTGDWTDPAVGGLILLGLVLGAVFLLVESRAKEPIVPLALFRIRTFTISVAATFLAAFGFFNAIIFLPRWFQTVAGASATESGYNLLPLLAGMIFAAIASGQIVARVGRYKWMMVGSLVLLAFALFLMTNLRSGTDRPILWLWMVLAGLGIGPSLAVFTLIVQNAVNPDRIGVATSSLTFFQQIGGTVGLTIGGTLFADRLTKEIPTQLVAAGVPQQMVDAALALFALYSIFYIVDQRQEVVVVSLGNPVRVVNSPRQPRSEAGLHMKLPWEETVRFDRRNLELEAQGEEIIASDQRRLVVDAFVRYRISDPLQFYRTLRNEEVANDRIERLVNSSLRQVLGSATSSEIISTRRSQLMQLTREDVSRRALASRLGIQIIDVRIRRAELPDGIRESVYRNMQTSRQQEAARIRAEGEQRKREIIAEADREVAITLATAQQTGETVRGEGDSQRTRIFAQSFGRDPSFAAFYRSMQAYESSLGDGKTTMVLSPDSAFFRYFERGPAGGR